jgi:uncharacterized membrane protein YraQ (UPF0718 family)
MKNFLYCLGIILSLLVIEAVMFAIAAFAAAGICNLFNLDAATYKYIGTGCAFVEAVVLAWILGGKK